MSSLVVLPTYNEAGTVAAVMAGVRRCLPAADILVVDDSSPDGTASVAAGQAMKLGRAEVLVRPTKPGLGPAYRAGFSWGLGRGYDVFVEMDADFSHDPAALPSLVAPLDRGYDLVIGSRYVAGGRVKNWAVGRRFLSIAGNLYTRAMLGLDVKDATAGFRAYTATLLEKIDLATVHADGYAFQVEMTYRAMQAGASVVEVPISFVDRAQGESKMSRAVAREAMWLVTCWGARRLAGWRPGRTAR
jgi:glycosyltransferase involved in cell wall biosynthesis